MTKINASVLTAKVELAADFAEANGGVFNRAAASGYLKLFGFTYDSKELSIAVKAVASERGISGSRVTFKEILINQIGETILDRETLIDYLVANDKETTDREINKYIRYVNLCERLIAKYQD